MLPSACGSAASPRSAVRPWGELGHDLAGDHVRWRVPRLPRQPAQREPVERGPPHPDRPAGLVDERRRGGSDGDPADRVERVREGHDHVDLPDPSSSDGPDPVHLTAFGRHGPADATTRVDAAGGAAGPGEPCPASSDDAGRVDGVVVASADGRVDEAPVGRDRRRMGLGPAAHQDESGSQQDQRDRGGHQESKPRDATEREPAWRLGGHGQRRRRQSQRGCGPAAGSSHAWSRSDMARSSRSSAAMAGLLGHRRDRRRERFDPVEVLLQAVERPAEHRADVAAGRPEDGGDRRVVEADVVAEDDRGPRARVEPLERRGEVRVTRAVGRCRPVVTRRVEWLAPIGRVAAAGS